MSPHSEPAANAAVPSIQRVLQDFLEDRRRSLSLVDFRLYRHVLFFLAYCINNQGHRNLDEADRALYERLYHCSGGEKLFFEIFGPEMLLPELDDFADSYLRKEVHTSEKVMRRAKEVVSSLRQWLLESGTLPASVLNEQEERDRERRRLRRPLRRLARALSKRMVSVEPLSLAPEDHVASDYHLLSGIESGRIWLRVYRSARAEELGPLLFPPGAAGSLRVGWNLCCALGRLRGRWELVEMEEIYPRT
jgi:hypothetical protein